LLAKPIDMRRIIVTLIITAIFPLSLIAQDLKTYQETFNEAEYFFMNGDYPDALAYYLQIVEKFPDNANIEYRIGVCYLNINGKKNLSIDYLQTASKNMSAKRKEGSVSQLTAPYDALFELGEAYLINYQFNNAQDAFKRYSATLLPDDHENIDFVNQQIRACDEAKDFISKPVAYNEDNIGLPFNDEKSNFNPVISADGKTFAYMVSLKFYNAVMVSRMANGKWSTPLNITPELESDGDVYISCLTSDGKTLYLSRDDNYNSDIYSSSFNGLIWAPAIKLNKNINTKSWESHGYVSEDGTQLIFASDRPGGFGGLDLYISKKVNGDWGPAVNLGPEINTQFNEDRPFLINNDKTLFFSSQGHSTMGGYDIFRSDIQSNNIWSQPKNLGYPLNTPDDNIFFMPVENGKAGYYSVFKESAGFGKEDIYKITFK
jgi:tetratricopeptide (TPR) repeat protein